MKEVFEKQLDLSQKNLLQSRSKNAFTDTLRVVKSLAPYRIWSTILSVLRRFRMISFILRFVSWIIMFLQTGTLVILSTLLFLIILPLLAAFFLGVLLSALLESKRSNEQMKTRLLGRRVYILFWNGKESAFFIWNLSDLATRENSAVLVISPFWLSARGVFSKSGKQFYFTQRKESKNIYLIRRYYLFSLRKKVLNQCDICYFY